MIEFKNFIFETCLRRLGELSRVDLKKKEEAKEEDERTREFVSD